MSQAETKVRAMKRSSWKNGKWKKRLAPYLFVLPNFLIFAVFIVIPAIVGVIYSFNKYDGLNSMKFLGLQNYKEIFMNQEFWASLGRTGIYTVVAVPCLYAVSLFIAMLLIKEVRMKGLFRAVIYWPTMISFIIVGLTWKWIFGDSFGILNYLMTLIGLKPISWLTNPFFANMSVVVATVWSKVGFYMVIFIAGLQAIPVDMYEAANLDGASKRQVFWKITLPLLKPTSVLVLMVSIIEAFKSYPLLLALTGGGPGKETTFIVQYIYDIGFSKQELGMASAMSVLLFIIIGIFSALQFRLSKGGSI
jgi:alpha-1,4-digalacturonate transport system permease protein